jgi:nicotinate phosphoribosyltransferase
LGAIQDAHGEWQPKLKLSEQVAKTSIPGVLQVRRFSKSALFVADMIFDERSGVDSRQTIVDPQDATRQRLVPAGAEAQDLLQPVLRQGRLLQEFESLSAIRERAVAQLARLHPGIRRFMNPHAFPVGIDIGLHEVRDRMIRDLRSGPSLAAK